MERSKHCPRNPTDWSLEGVLKLELAPTPPFKNVCLASTLRISASVMISGIGLIGIGSKCQPELEESDRERVGAGALLTVLPASLPVFIRVSVLDGAVSSADVDDDDDDDDDDEDEEDGFFFRIAAGPSPCFFASSRLKCTRHNSSSVSLPEASSASYEYTICLLYVYYMHIYVLSKYTNMYVRIHM